MRLSSQKNQDIRTFLIQNIEKHPKDLAKLTSKQFGLSRQAALNHINRLKKEGIVLTEGRSKGIKYSLASQAIEFALKITPDLDEGYVWTNSLVPSLPQLPENVKDICAYGFTEMLNNAKDHSESDIVMIHCGYTAATISFWIIDQGIGIFKKIQKAFNLEYKKDAILELAKGKLTTDPDNHSGEGIFFTSRMFDSFSILSEDLHFSGHENDDWLLENARSVDTKGTSIFMLISRFSALDLNDVFNKFAPLDEDASGFAKTHVPVKLVQHEGEALVSRSQAKRLVARFGSFKEIILDFAGITTIGQGFADQIFRVFKREHPEVNLVPVNLSENVTNMINHVLSAKQTKLF